MNHRGYEHLTNSIPNNFITRWLIRLANRNMKKAGSMYLLRIRYRKPRKGYRYSLWGSLSRHEAKRIALYLRRR